MTALIALHVAFLLAVTSNPFHFGEFERMGFVSWWAGPRDVAANVALLMPLALALRASGARWWMVIAGGVGASAFAETLQLFNTRVTSPIDLAANTCGVVLIAALPKLQASWLRAPVAMIPVLWSIGLTWRLLPPVTVCVAGALIVGVAVGLAAPWARWTSLVWCAVAVAPIAAHSRTATLALVVGGLLSALSIRRPLPPIAAAIGCAAAGLLILSTADPESLFGHPSLRWRIYAGILFTSLAAAPIVVAVLLRSPRPRSPIYSDGGAPPSRAPP